jgi:signal transduction histidine kinase
VWGGVLARKVGKDWRFGRQVCRRKQQTNVFRHAGAAHVDLRLRIVEREMELEIKDDGQGLAPDSLPTSQMLGMRERAAAFSGTLDIRSELGKGTTVRLRMPMP